MDGDREIDRTDTHIIKAMRTESGRGARVTVEYPGKDPEVFEDVGAFVLALRMGNKWVATQASSLPSLDWVILLGDMAKAVAEFELRHGPITDSDING